MYGLRTSIFISFLNFRLGPGVYTAALEKCMHAHSWTENQAAKIQLSVVLWPWSWSLTYLILISEILIWICGSWFRSGSWTVWSWSWSWSRTLWSWTQHWNPYNFPKIYICKVFIFLWGGGGALFWRGHPSTPMDLPMHLLSFLPFLSFFFFIIHSSFFFIPLTLTFFKI